MIFETVYSIGDVVYRATGEGKVSRRVVTSVKVQSGKDGTQISYGVDVNNGFTEAEIGKLIFPDYDQAVTQAKLLEKNAMERVRYFKELEVENAKKVLKEHGYDLP
jgi:hypothetical protein